MAKFDFSSLPNELKCSVLDCVRFHDARELFRSTKSLRQYYLCFGLFPKRIKKLSMEFDFLVDVIRNISIVFNEEEAISRVAEGEWQPLAEEEIIKNKEFRRMILDPEIEDRKYQEYLLSIVSTIRSCKTVDLRLDDEYVDDDDEKQVDAYLHHLFKEKKILANIQRVASLEIHDQHFICFDKLSRYYNPIVDESVLFSGRVVSESTDFNTSLDRNGLEHCKFLHFNGLPLNIQSLAKTSGEVYTFFWNYYDRCKALDDAMRVFFAKAEIPGTNPKATVVLIERQYPDDYEPWRLSHDLFLFLEDLDDYLDIEWIDPKSGQIRPITEFETFEIEEENELKLAIENDSLLKQFLRIEEKISRTRFDYLNLRFKQKKFGYFRYRNLLLITRICGDEDRLDQLQLIIESMPSDF